MRATTLVHTSADSILRVHTESWLSQIEQQALLQKDLVKSGAKPLPLPALDSIQQSARKLSRSESCADAGPNIQIWHDLQGQDAHGYSIRSRRCLARAVDSTPFCCLFAAISKSRACRDQLTWSALTRYLIHDMAEQQKAWSYQLEGLLAEDESSAEETWPGQTGFLQLKVG